MRELKVVAAVLALAGLAVVSTPAADLPAQVSTSVGGFESGAATEFGSAGANSSSTPSASGGAVVEGGSGSVSSGPSGSSRGQQPRGAEDNTSARTATSSLNGSGAVGPGIEDDSITVGIGWFDVNGAIAAFGSPGQSEGSSPTTKEGAQRIIDWMNANGGIAGHTIIPAYHEYPINEIATNDTRDRREQAMCSDWTEDNVAFAAIPYLDTQGVFYRCAAEHGLVGLSTNDTGAVTDKKSFAEFGGTYWRPNWILGERRERIVVEQLDRRGFFEPGARVGLLLGSQAPSRATAESTLKPMLEALGVNVVAEVVVTDLSDPWTSHVFKFQSAGVTHILGGQIACGTGICLALLQQAAENQGYRPQYGVGSDWGAGSAGLFAPRPAQMANTVSIGWNSKTDTDGDDYDTANPINEYDARCRQIIKDSGLDIAMRLVTPYCDGLFFLKDGLERASQLTWQGLRQAVEAAGTSLMVGTVYGTAFGPGRHDGATFVHDMAYDREAETWHYVGPPIPVG